MRKHNYVVGFIGEGQVVYGKDENHLPKWVEPLTLAQAKKRLNKLAEGKKSIYKLVKV